MMSRGAWSVNGVLGPVRDGLIGSSRAWRALLPLLIANLALALLASLPLALAALGTIGRRPWLGDLTTSRWPVVLEGLEGWAAASGLAGSAPPPTATLFLTGLLGMLAIPAQALAYAALAGGLVERYLGVPGSYGAAARRWRWPFLRLWLLSLPAQALALLVPFLLLSAVGVQTWSAIMVAVPVLLLIILNALFELARVAMVATGARGGRRGVASAFVLLRSRPGAILGVWVVLAVLGATALAVSAIGTVGPRPAPLLASTVVTVLAAVLEVWSKGIRLAAQASLYRRLAGSAGVAAGAALDGGFRGQTVRGAPR